MTDKDKGKRNVFIHFCDNTDIVLALDDQVVRDLVKNIATAGYSRMNSWYEDYQISINWDKVKWFTVGNKL